MSQDATTHTAFLKENRPTIREAILNRRTTRNLWDTSVMRRRPGMESNLRERKFNCYLAMSVKRNGTSIRNFTADRATPPTSQRAHLDVIRTQLKEVPEEVI
jgi:hypothetical protein